MSNAIRGTPFRDFAVQNLNVQSQLSGCRDSQIRVPVINACDANVTNLFVQNLTIVNPETGEVINLPEDLAETLVVGNFTGGTDMVVSAGDAITTLAGDSLFLSTGDNPGGDTGSIFLNPGTEGAGAIQRPVVINNGAHLVQRPLFVISATSIASTPANLTVGTGGNTTDVAGTITARVTGAILAGNIVEVLFAKPFSNPVVLLTHNPNTAPVGPTPGTAIPLFVSLTATTGFRVAIATAAAVGDNLDFNYWVIDTV
jgi:hypothetical protein